jgi:DNA-binding SARP family transcriptional activator
MLSLMLLGPFAARVDGRPVPLRLPTQKAVAVLAYLALRDETRVSRDGLASLLWNDVPVTQGRHSLRQELTHIRAALGDCAPLVLQADRETVDLRRDAVSVDVRRFVDLVTQHTPASLREAVGLYRGPLLAGLRTREASFDIWLEATRANLNRLAAIAFEAELEALRASNDLAGAAVVALKLSEIQQALDSHDARLRTLHAVSDVGARRPEGSADSSRTPDGGGMSTILKPRASR